MLSSTKALLLIVLFVVVVSLTCSALPSAFRITGFPAVIVPLAVKVLSIPSSERNAFPEG